MRKNRTYDRMEDVNRFVAYVAMTSSVIFPEVVEKCKCPKLFMPIVKNISKVIIICLFIFQIENITALALLDWRADFTMAVYHCITTTNSACAIYRITCILTNQKALHECIQHVQDNFRSLFQKKLRQNSIGGYTKFVNLMTVSNLLGQSLFLIFMNLYSAIAHGTEPHPTPIPGDRSKPYILWPLILFGLFTGLGFIWSMSSFEWTLLTLLRLAEVEMICLRKQLKAIFSMIQYNSNYEICIKKDLFGGGNEPSDKEPITFIPAADHINLQTASSDKFHFKRQCQVIDKLLGECVKKHAKMIQYTANCKKMFGGPMLLTYIFTVALSASWILTDSSSVEKNIYFLPFFSFAATANLFALSYCGQKFTNACEEIVEDATNCAWNIYPLPIQKKLLFIVLISQKKFQVDGMGLVPLSMESFYAIIKVCYSLLSFVWTYK